MKIYTAGWALENPAFNVFKRFLKRNVSRIEVGGILYPKRVPPSIEGIPVIEFADGRTRFDGPLVDCMHRDNNNMRDVFARWCETEGVPLISVPQLVSRLIAEDTGDTWCLPFEAVSGADIRALAAKPLPGMIEGRFADIRSWHLAQKLHHILASSHWDRLLDFDQDDTLDAALLRTVQELWTTLAPASCRILGPAVQFLDVLLGLMRHGLDVCDVVITQEQWRALGPRRSFYGCCFGERLVVIDDEAAQPPVPGEWHLSDSLDALLSRTGAALPSGPVVVRLRGSLVDYHRMADHWAGKDLRVSLVQPDIAADHLVATVLC